MQKMLLAVALVVAFAVFLTGTAAAEEAEYRTEVWVNASNAADAKNLFPDAEIRVLPDFADPDMNGWRIVSGEVKTPEGMILAYAEEIQLRERETNPTSADS
ncbi:MAG: hypothetical protein HYV04_17695 [Deltaproteobacteria bacterium]|nr:hypothetical protein [Deltaproteobacteria bacterium]